MAQRRLNAIVEGRVQGVGYRFFAREAAGSLGLTGCVRNTLQGSVEIVAEGEEDRLEEFLAMIQEGPRSARVTGVNVTWTSPTNEYREFSVEP